MAEAAGKDGAFCAEAADSVLHAVNRNRYSEERGLYADTPEKCWFSQHSNIWAVLAGAADHERSNHILDAVLIDKTLSPCTLYFSFYLLEVLCENGRFEAFLDQLIGSSFQLGPNHLKRASILYLDLHAALVQNWKNRFSEKWYSITDQTSYTE